MPTVLAMPNDISNADIIGYLDNYIRQVSVGGSQAAANTDYVIYFPNKYSTDPQNASLNYDLSPINLMSGSTLTIDGRTRRGSDGGGYPLSYNNYTLNGNGNNRGLVVYAGSVTIQNLNVINTIATGGDGGAGGGGGGAGLGGGLLVAAGANVTLVNSHFDNNAATGGNGGAIGSGSGGGGGLGGDGGAGNGGAGGGGGFGHHGYYGGASGGKGAADSSGGATGGIGGTGYGGIPGIHSDYSGYNDGIGENGHTGGDWTEAGGGGAGLSLNAGGGGGGVVGLPAPFFRSGNTNIISGGNGGFGGGGGGGYNNGGAGGFGGGGGGSAGNRATDTPNPENNHSIGGGNGGFGGGGGNNGGVGGYGGGNGGTGISSGGGGGLGAGGSIFVQAGGSVTVVATTFTNARETGGNGAGGGGNGAALGDIFIQSTLALNPIWNGVLFADPNRTNSMTIAESIAGTGGILAQGGGTLTLSGSNSYTGGTVAAGTAVAFSSNANLGADQSPIRATSGGSFNVVTTDYFIFSHPIQMGDSGSIVDSAGDTFKTLVIQGVISDGPNGPGSLTLSGGDRFDLSAANTYTGTLSVTGTGTSVAITADNNLGATGAKLSLSGGATLRAGNNVNVRHAIQISGSATIDNQGFGDTFSGGIKVDGTGLFHISNNAPVTVSAPITGSGSIVVDGGGGNGNGTGKLLLNSADSQAGGIQIKSGILELAAASSAGAAISFTDTASKIIIDDTAFQNRVLTRTISNFTTKQTIDLSGLSYDASRSAYTINAAAGQLSITNGTVTDTITLAGLTNNALFALSSDGIGGTLVKSLPARDFQVGSLVELNDAISKMDATGTSAAANTHYTITLKSDIDLTAELYAINLMSGSSLTINGSNGSGPNYKINGLDGQRGFLVYSGAVEIDHLTMSHTRATGGTGGTGAGGGAGLGGGLFVASGGNVTLNDVSFAGDSAVGGRGGDRGFALGGGGGLGGNGSFEGSFSNAGAGGGVGLGAGGAGGIGIILGASGGGAGGGINGGGGGGLGGGGGVAGGNPDSSTNRGGAGGFGGGGGANVGPDNGFYSIHAGPGGQGGFGGGGGGGGGVGGFGGGGSGTSTSPNIYRPAASGGFGGGQGEDRSSYSGAGGGGLGAGGAIFVQQGGSLTFGTGEVAGSSVTAGMSGDGSTTGPTAGLGLGSGIFIQGNQTLNLAPAATKTLTIANVIADQTGSGGTGANAGAGRLSISGGGKVVLGGANTYTGGTEVSGAGTVLAIAADNNLGGAASTLKLDDGTGITFSGSFTVNHAIKVSGDPTFTVSAGNTVTQSGTISDGTSAGDVVVTGGGTLVLNVANSYSGGTVINGSTLELASSGAGGSGGIAFHGGTADTLRLDRAAFAGTSFGNAITNFAKDDVIDLSEIAYDPAATLSYSSGILLIRNGAGATLASLSLGLATGSVAGSLALVSDGRAGTPGTAIELVPSIASVSAATADNATTLNAAKVVTVTASFTEAVTVTGTPQLRLNNGAFGSYAGGTGTGALTFTYTVQAGQDIDDLQVQSLSLNGGTIADSTGHAALLSNAAADLNLRIDTVAPTGPMLALTNDTGLLATDNVTSNAAITYTATETGGTLLYKADSAAGFSTTVPTITGDGVHTVAVKQQDAAGNVSTVASLTFTLDTTAPATPTITGFVGNRNPAVGDLTNDGSPTLTITAETGSSVDVLRGGTVVGTATETAAGSGLFTFMSAALGDGTYSFTARATDAAGNAGVASAAQSVTIDTVAPSAPAAPVLTQDTGSSATDRITSDPAITYASPATGDTLLYSLDGGAYVPTAPAFATDGTAEGQHTIAIKERDAAGNVSGLSSLTFTLDTVAPTVTAMLAIDTGASSPSRVTSNPAMTGTAEAGGTVTLLNGSTTLGTATVASNGSWSFAPVLPDGSVTLTAAETDTAGNTGSATLSFTLYRPPPDPPGPTGGDDSLAGTGGPDQVALGLGSDTYTGGAGADIVYGNQGNDLIYGNQDNDIVYGGMGDDREYGGQGDDRLFGNLGNDVVYGNLGDDIVYGNQGTDALYSGQGNDVLYGGMGDDTLLGGMGDDTLVGGVGADRYVFDLSSGRDLILGFSQGDGDRIALGGQTYTVTQAANGDALLNLSGGGIVDLAGIQLGQVNASYFA